MIEILSFGLNNLSSVKNGLEAAGANNVRIISDASQSQAPRLLILPGTGNFGAATRELESRGYGDLVKATVADRTAKVFGICLGFHLLFDSSDESIGESGLGLVSGRVQKLSQGDGCEERVPRVGWAPIFSSMSENIFQNQLNSDVYFSHSYHPVPEVEQTNSMYSPYCNDQILVGFLGERLGGFQFHPERSSKVGLALLTAICSWANVEK